MPEEGFKGELHLSCFAYECQSHAVTFYCIEGYNLILKFNSV